MQSRKPSNKMTPYPHLQKMPSSKTTSAHLYSKNNLSALRKLTLPTSRNPYPFLVSSLPKSNTDRRNSKGKPNLVKQLIDKRVHSTQTNFNKRRDRNQNIARNELFRERNSAPIKDETIPVMLSKGYRIKDIPNHRSNHSLYSSGKNHLFGKAIRHTGSSLGGKDSLGSTTSPKLTQLKSGMGKLKKDFDRKISRDNAKFLKEFDKFGKTSTLNQYVKPKLKLVQKEGEAHLGTKAFTKASFSRPQNSRERYSVGMSCQMEKLSNITTNSNTFKQLEKVRIFDVRSKWFKPKKSLNYSEKVEKAEKIGKARKRKSLGVKAKPSKVKQARERFQSNGLMLSLRKNINQDKDDASPEKKVFSNLTSKQKSIDLYSKIKYSHQKSQKSFDKNSSDGISFYKKIYR